MVADFGWNVAGRPTNVPAERLAGFGTSVFTEMSALAERTGAINLGQGFPDEDGPVAVLDAAAAALYAGANQYAPLPGVPALRAAIAEHQRRRYGLEVDPDTEVQVTFGATEAIAAALLGLCDPGDEVIALDPAYDSYAAGAALAGARLRRVPLHPPDWRFDVAELEAAVSERTRLVLLNSPHNPTGRVLDRAELEAVAAVCRDHDLIAVTDEVYEHLVFEGEHVPLATLPGMAERTLTISSIGKTFSVTGWKIGWACGPAELVAAVRGAKQFMTFAGGTPLQHASAVALGMAEEQGARLSAELAAKRDRLCAGLERAGFEVLRPAATYFVNADVRALGSDDAVAFCRDLPARAGVVAIPTSVFSGDPERVRSLVRFAFCKREEVIDEAARRLAALR
jgi:N-succinyldiaminopimelate aminotransferase